MNTTSKSILRFLLLASLLTLAIMGWHWTEVANSLFWWTFWVVAALAAIPTFIFLVHWYGKRKNK
jgi:hypothetical protein